MHDNQTRHLLVQLTFNTYLDITLLLMDVITMNSSYLTLIIAKLRYDLL